MFKTPTFKTIVTLMRAAAAVASEEVTDRNALLVLDQQMRDARAGLTRAQRALAVALAEDAQETLHIEASARCIVGLEERARAALAAGREDLATEAAEAIADLEAERDTGAQARSLFGSQIVRLRRTVANAERRLADLQRGRRVARVEEAVRHVRRGRIEASAVGECSLSEAEATLARLRDRQTFASLVEDALDGVAAATRPKTVEERLGKAGLGPALRPTAESVLARLTQTHVMQA